jgi:hypothetical protein
MQTQQIESVYQQLLARKMELEKAKSPGDVINETMSKLWSPTEKARIEQFREKMNNLQQIVKLEIAIVESIREYVPGEIIEDITSIFPKIRETNNLQNMTGVHLKNKDNVKMRQVLKLVTAIYRYNRDLFTGENCQQHSVYKSRIKHATLCPNCGEISKKILHNMVCSKVVSLP